MIKLDQIEVTFGDFVALKNINIHVKEGDYRFYKAQRRASQCPRGRYYRYSD